MQTFVLSIVVILMAMTGLAIGLFFRRPPIKSCGGAACRFGLDCAACPSHGPESRS